MQMFLFANVSFASSNLQNLFIVKGIEVSQTSYSSSEAKKKALNVARDEAFRVVLDRLLISSDVANVVFPDDYNVEKFIQTVKLNNEKMTSTSYSAVVDVQINKNLMLDYLKNQGLKVLEDVPPSTLVIFKNGDVLNFENANYGNSNVVKFYTYNMQSLSWFDLDNSDISAYKSLLNTYNATNVMIVDVVDMGQGIYKISFKDKLLGIESEFETNSDNAISDFVVHINDAYKLSTNEGDFGKSVSMLVPIMGLSDWIQLEKTISKVPSIKSFEVQALKYNKVQLKLKYNYDLNSVINDLRVAGLDVQNKNTYLIVKR